MGATLTVNIGNSIGGGSPLEMLDVVSAGRGGEISLLHSAGAEAHSVLAFEPLISLEIDADGKAALTGTVEPLARREPLAMLEELIGRVSFAAPHPLIGWLGFISYDIGRTLEQIPPRAADALHWPLLRWSLYRYYLLHDPVSGEWRAVGIDADPGPLEDMLKHELRTLARAGGGTLKRELRGAEAVISSGDFAGKVKRAKQYIAAGDIYQANLAQHWEVETAEDAAAIYRRLCASSPAPFAAFLRFTSAPGTEREVARHVLSASPELFLRVSEGRVFTRPIKGTRRRDLGDAARDEALREELLNSEKDRAELAMIVDLLRNDLGRVAKYGTVRVEAAREMERHPTVWHTAATIAAELRPDAGLAELLAAVCPGGSITGAPKIRAMQIIEELEGFRRGMYCGNIGVIGPEGKTMHLNIAIRSIMLQEGMAHVYAGGGIVADSDPREETQETLDKAAAMLRALGAEAW